MKYFTTQIYTFLIPDNKDDEDDDNDQVLTKFAKMLP